MKLGNIIDKTIGVFSPEAELKRRAYREKTKVFQVLNKGYSEHGASKRKKSLIGMDADSGTADEDIGENHTLLVKRSRSLWQGSTVATAAIKNVVTNSVGTSLQPKPNIDSDYVGLNEKQKEEIEGIIEKHYNFWKKDCGYFKGESFEELQSLVMLSQLMSGDVFILLPIDESLQLQIIEADQVANGMLGGNQDIKNGVEMKDGKIVAYHIKGKAFETPKRIELRGKDSNKRNILHIMQSERPGQRRGVPFLAHVIEDLKQLDRYQKAELHAAVISSFLTVFVQTADVTDPLGIPPVPESEQVDSEDESSYELGQGSVVTMDKGETISVVNPARQNATFDSFITSISRNIGAALEIPFEVLLKHFSSSYSASRAALLELWKMIKNKRHFLINQFCRPVYEEFITILVYEGKIPYVNIEQFKNDPLYRESLFRSLWYGPSQGQIDPLKEVVAAEKRISLGITTRSQETMEMNGGDWEKNAIQLKKEKELLKELDLLTEEKKSNTSSPEESGGSRGGKRDGAGRKKVKQLEETGDGDDKGGEEDE